MGANKVGILDEFRNPYTNTNPLATTIVGPDGQQASVGSNGSLDVNISDQTSELIDLHLSLLIDTVTLTRQHAIDDYDIDFDSLTAPVVGNIICLKEDVHFYQGTILSVVDNGANNYTATVDMPLDFAYTILGGCSIRETNLITSDGSVTPVTYIISPKGLAPGTRWDVVRVLFYIEGDIVMDDGKFGSDPALLRGLVLRHVDGHVKNIFNVKTNGDFVKRNYDRGYASAAKQPTGTNYTVASRRTFGGQSKNGVVIRLTTDDEDELQVIVQDDLTGGENTRMEVIIQGHIVED